MAFAAAAVDTWQRAVRLSSLRSGLRQAGVDPARILLASGSGAKVYGPFKLAHTVCGDGRLIRLGRPPVIGQRAQAEGPGFVAGASYGPLRPFRPVFDRLIADGK
jgi:hypothetical protein